MVFLIFHSFIHKIHVPNKKKEVIQSVSHPCMLVDVVQVDDKKEKSHKIKQKQLEEEEIEERQRQEWQSSEESVVYWV